ncbi:MAG: flagellar hook basal-body protein [Candidatus Margulisiibacteriota bacterium]
MQDHIFEIGGAAIDKSEQEYKKLMDNIVYSQIPGYRESSVTSRSFPIELEAAKQRLSPMKPQVDGSYFNQTAGALIKTDGPLDVALGSDGYFVIEGNWGEGYTRDGRFHLDKDGRLLSVAGNFPVMGQGGAITVNPEGMIDISQDGDIRVDGEIVDRLRVVKPENNLSLDPLSGSIFKKGDPNDAFIDVEDPRVIVGYVEGSNADISLMMMKMISLQKISDINTGFIKDRSNNLSKAMELGKSQ